VRDPAWRGVESDDGAVTVLAAATVGVVLTISVAIAASGAVVVERHRVATSADSAALAAADVAAGAMPGSSCEVASRLAAANRTHLSGCLQERTTVTVTVSSAVGPFVVHAVATAGQPDAEQGFHTVPSKK
jgi:secretion/DNA translocation related TadE-like protein